jgi:hypothetical protein
VSEDAPNDEKEVLQQELRALGVTVNEAWEVPALKRKLTMAKGASSEDAPNDDHGASVAHDRPVVKAEPAKTKGDLYEVKLLKNYRPVGEYEIVGHQKAARYTKNAAGETIEAEAAQFIKGEMAPPPLPGVSFENKVWAGTSIRIGYDEAKRIVEKKIGERGFD